LKVVGSERRRGKLHAFEYGDLAVAAAADLAETCLDDGI
jgi:hypothetical protein